MRARITLSTVCFAAAVFLFGATSASGAELLAMDQGAMITVVHDPTVQPVYYWRGHHYPYYYRGHYYRYHYRGRYYRHRYYRHGRWYYY